MKVFTSKTELQNEVGKLKGDAKKIGLVPTMGALHEGHASLIKRCSHDNDVCVASIFVNPTQFNDKTDLSTYPRTPDADLKLLEENGCDIVFMPTVEEIYPEKDNRVFDLGEVSKVMEGAYREGHFNGVAQVVSKLFYIVTPDYAYFGEKDFQQIAVIRSMVKSLNIPVEIVACPIIRQADGLAMSSRNKRLSEEGRNKAPKIAEVLSESRKFVGVKSVEEVKSFVENKLSKETIFKLDYYDIVDGNSLQSVHDWNSNYIVGCIAIYVGDVREIDNIIYKNVD